MAKEAKSRIEELIVNDNVLEAIEIFYAQEDHEEIVNRIILLKSNFNSLNRKIHAGVLSFEEETRALNKIKMELLDLVSMASIQPKSENSDKADQNFKFKEYSEDFGQLKMNVEKLTRDQYNVLRFLNKMNRVRISGCAGSGKTLVAIEKAIRLSQSGMSVIILCHNPFLSRKIRKLVKASTVFVSSFADFLKGIVDHGNLVQPLWNSYRLYKNDPKA